MRAEFLAIAYVLLAVASTPSAHAWQTAVRVGSEDNDAKAIAVDRTGNVAIGGITNISGDQGIGAIAAVSRTGLPRWTMRFAEPGSRVQSLHFDRTGDLVVGARINGDDETYFGPFTVRKLDGRTGGELWRDALRGSSEYGGAVVVDETGDAIVGTVVLVPDPQEDYLIRYVLRRLSGADGSERWRRANGGIPIALAGQHVLVRMDRGLGLRSLADGSLVWEAGLHTSKAVIDRAGDVVALQMVDLGGVTVTKLAAADGSVRWSRTFAPAELGSATLVVDRRGDVVVTGSAWADAPAGDLDVVVMKLAGADGVDRWRVRMDGLRAGDAQRLTGGLVVSRHGDIFVSATLSDPEPYSALMRLRGRDGSVAWNRRGLGGHLWALAPGESVVAGGARLLPPTPETPYPRDAAFVVTKLRGRSGRGLPPQ